MYVEFLQEHPRTHLILLTQTLLAVWQTLSHATTPWRLWFQRSSLGLRQLHAHILLRQTQLELWQFAST
jgi:hypothetical protein